MQPHIHRSLSVHLRETEDHSRLPFHPGCPVCRRDRLAGSLTDELVSPRAQAVIAAGLLAFSTGGVPAATASEPDEVNEGTAEAIGDDDPGASAVFDPGGETVQLPDEAPQTPEAAARPAPDAEDLGALEHEPPTDQAEPVVNEVIAAPPADPPPAPEPQPVAPPSVEAPPTAAPEQSEVERGPQILATTERTKRRPQRPAEVAVESSPAVTMTAEPTTTPAAEPATAAAAAAPPTTPVVAGAATGRAAPGDRFHTVRPGESLWSIAADVLGERATVANVAREVNRLWELNDERIGTGQPDLLFAGTALRLR